MRKLLIFAVLAALKFRTGFAFADRPNESRNAASHVIVGEVLAVYVSETKSYKHYALAIEIEQVERGLELLQQDVVYVTCYQRKPGQSSLDADSEGHLSVPKAGERVHVFLQGQRGRYEGLYPDWMDVLKPRSGRPEQAF